MVLFRVVFPFSGGTLLASSQYDESDLVASISCPCLVMNYVCCCRARKFSLTSLFVTRFLNKNPTLFFASSRPLSARLGRYRAKPKVYLGLHYSKLLNKRSPSAKRGAQ